MVIAFELLPPAFVTTRVTVYFFAVVNLWDTLAVVAVPPSPKVHFLEDTVPVLLSVKVTVNGCGPDVLLAVKAATGGAVFDTAIVFETFPDPAAFFAVRVTVFVPAEVYLCVTVLPEALVPSPNCQDHPVGEFVAEPVNVKVVAVVPVLGDIAMLGTGTGTFVTVTVFETFPDPTAFFAVRVTVFVPAEVYLCVTVLPEADPPSPNCQDHPVGEFVAEPVNVKVVAVVPVLGDIAMVGTGTGTFVTVTVFETFPDPTAFFAVRVTVFVPAEVYLCV